MRIFLIMCVLLNLATISIISIITIEIGHAYSVFLISVDSFTLDFVIKRTNTASNVIKVSIKALS